MPADLAGRLKNATVFRALSKDNSPYSVTFAKLHGAGNDFVLLDAEALLADETGRLLLSRWQHAAPLLAKNLCHRNFGIGADGLILCLNLANREERALAETWYGKDVDNAQLAWTYTNGDGSESNMCGNGLRCLALWGYRFKLKQSRFNIVTAAGLVSAHYESSDAIEVGLGFPRLGSDEIPCRWNGTPGQVPSQIIDQPLTVGATTVQATCVNVGNPHCVIFSPELLANYNVQLPLAADATSQFFPRELAELATAIQKLAAFPESVNVEFVGVRSASEADCLVWERGCGPTLACGSAAVAVLVAGVVTGKLARQARITLPGGIVTAAWHEADNHLSLTGPARLVYTGQVELPDAVLTLIKPPEYCRR